MASYLFGQLTDPNIYTLYRHFDYFIDLSLDMHWDLQTNKLYVDETELPDITHGFIRFNVFEQQTQQKYANYYLVSNYLRHNAKTYNENYHGETPFKLTDLMLAKKIGLNIPHTEVTKSAITSKETIVNKKSGFLYKHDDPRELAKVLNTVIQLSQDELKSIGNEGRKNVTKKFDVETMCQSNLKEYKKLIKN